MVVKYNFNVVLWRVGPTKAEVTRAMDIITWLCPALFREVRVVHGSSDAQWKKKGLYILNQSPPSEYFLYAHSTEKPWWKIPYTSIPRVLCFLIHDHLYVYVSGSLIRPQAPPRWWLSFLISAPKHLAVIYMQAQKMFANEQMISFVAYFCHV